MSVHLTTKEIAQINKTIALLQNYHDRRCADEGISVDHEQYDDDPAWHAKVAETRLHELVSDDKVMADREREQAEFDAMLNSGRLEADLRRIVRGKPCR